MAWSPEAEREDEIACLRLIVETLVAAKDVPWAEILRIVDTYDSPLGRASWRITYRFALVQAARSTEPKPLRVLSELPLP
jgi:hypothetical protein